ncbi:coiled-coil domain-containing protein [Bacillus songklensis]|uniref:Coiled-coil domain-containing protein n=1 Tax=Bacillus songklensis TaxID=1069116 RepID=A0ABV8B6P5_9BACI
MKRNLVILNTTIMLGVGSIFAIPTVNAESINDMQIKKEKIQQQRAEVQSGIQRTNEEINRLQDEQAKFLEQIKRLSLAINENSNKVQETQNQIDQKTAEIKELESEIAVLKEKFEKRFELLKERARSFQESGGNVSYLEVLLGSSSFGDFIDRAVAVTRIAEADQGILKQTKEDQKNLEDKQASIEKKLADLKSLKTELDGMMAQLTEQKTQKDALVAQLKVKEEENANLKADLQAKDGTLSLQESAVQKDIERELKRNAELEAAKRHAAEKAPKLTEFVGPISGNRGDVVTVGNKWIGNSAYVFGGGRNQYDIANGLFDCSSFVHWAFSQVGINLGPLGSVSTESLKHLGKQVPVNQMQPGDLVFFDTYKKDGHVGIYVGNGKFIGSQSSTGVAIADMSRGYWKQKFNGRVKRI